MGDVSNAAACAAKALELRRAVGTRYAIATGLADIGEVDLCQGSWSRAIEHFRDAVRVSGAKEGRSRARASTRYVLGRAYLGAGQRAQALRSFREGMQVMREAQNVTHPGVHRQTLSRLLSGLEEAYGDRCFSP